MSAKGSGWTPAQRKANRKYFAALKKAGKSAWTPERKARFLATMEIKRAAKKSATRKEMRERNALVHGVDIDAGTPRANGNGGTHFPLDVIPDKMPLRATAPLRPRAKSNGGTREFPDNAEGARLAVAMQLLRTVDRLLRLDE